MLEVHVVAKILLSHPNGDVLVLRRSKDAPRRPLQSDIPGGWVDEGEDLKAAAVRECLEETGIQLAADDLGLVYTHTAVVEGNKNTSWLFFIGRTEEQEVTLSPEHDQANWLSLDKAIEAIPYKVQQDFLIHVRDNDLLRAA